MDMKILSWNVNGMRSAWGKGLKELIAKGEYDVIMLQEIKSDTAPAGMDELGYKTFIYPAKRKGYSGVMSLSKTEPLSVMRGIGDKEFDDEGRVITLEFAGFYAVNSYFPNSQHGLTRLDFKLKFDREIEEFLQRLRKRKPVVICGDFNVAHEEIDIARPKDNENNAGFTAQERDWMTEFIKRGYIDTYRMFVKDGGHYSWWTYRFNAREKNIGWRIDYCIVSEELKDKVRKADILTDQRGSDHAPVTLELKA
ncbi:MAG: exodeoxyribonuclease III [Candidatus Parvarchaeota archaeon]